MYATASTVPAIVAIVAPGRWNWALWAMNENMTTPTNAQSGQARTWIGADGSNGAGTAPLPSKPPTCGTRAQAAATCGAQLAMTRARTPPKTVLPDGRALVWFKSPTISNAEAPS